VRLFLMVFGVAFGSITAWSQTVSSMEEILEGTVRCGCTDGHLTKMLAESGDAAAVSLSKVLGRKGSLLPHEISISVDVIQMAFAGPGTVESVPDREPRTALVVLQYLNSLTEDAETKKRIGETRTYILERYAASKHQQLNDQASIDRELGEDLAALESQQESRNFGQVEAIVRQGSAKWQSRDRSAFLSFMSKACAVLSSYDLGDRGKQSVLLNQLAMTVLEGGGLALKNQMEFVEFLTRDPVGLDGEAWSKLRLAKTKLWLEAWRRVSGSIDPNFDFEDLPLMNVSPPNGVALPPGISPESIRDPKLRRDYETAIVQNAAKATRFNEQYWLKNNAARFLGHVERYLINAYSRPPDDLPGLDQLLSEYVADKDVHSRVLNETRTRARQ
jgi:hypothetical protein